MADYGQIQIYYIATSKAKEIRDGMSVASWEWNKNHPGKARTFKNPSAKSVKKVAYSKTKKNKAGDWTKTIYKGGVTVHGTHIPATATRMIAGVSRTVEVGYQKRGYTIYKRTKKLKDKKPSQMYKKTYTQAKPRQYRLIYKDKPVQAKAYASYENGYERLFFGTEYYKDGEKVTRSGHLMHPTECSFTYSDVYRNFESNANNGDNRDNTGKYVLSRVRANVMTIALKWEGMPAVEGDDLLDTLNPNSNSGKKREYLEVQYRPPHTGTYRTGIFYASERTAVKFPNGNFKEISVTLTEV